MIPRQLNEEKGIILPLVLILTLILMITGLVFVSLGVQENSLVRKEIAKRQAFYLAEAGIEKTVYHLFKVDSDWQEYIRTGMNRPTTKDVVGRENLGDGHYEVTIKLNLNSTYCPDNTAKIESIGFVKDVIRKVNVEAQRVMPGRLNEVETDFQVLPQSEEKDGKKNILFVAVPKSMVRQRMETLGQAGLNPIPIDIDCLALANCFLRLKSLAPEENVMVLNLGTRLINLVTLGKESLYFIRDISLGLESPLDLKDIEFDPSKLGSGFTESKGYLLAIGIGL